MTHRFAATLVAVALSGATTLATAATSLADVDYFGDLTGIAADSRGNVLLARGAYDGSRGMLVFVHDGKARVIHRFAPYDQPLDIISTPAGFVGWKGYPENQGSAFAVINGAYKDTYKVVDTGFGTQLTTPAVPFLGGLLVAGDGGIGSLCAARKGHSPCGALYRFDARGGRVVKAFSHATDPEILAADGTHAWFYTRTGLDVIDVSGTRRVANIRPLAVMPLEDGRALAAIAQNKAVLTIVTVRLSGTQTYVTRVPFSSAPFSSCGRIRFVSTGDLRKKIFVTCGDQLSDGTTDAYRIYPAPTKKVQRIVDCTGRWTAVENVASFICADSHGLTYLSAGGKRETVASEVRGAPIRATAGADGSVWIVTAPPSTYQHQNPETDSLMQLVHFRPGKAAVVLPLPSNVGSGRF
jgi:hypothetical protein